MRGNRGGFKRRSRGGGGGAAKRSNPGWDRRRDRDPPPSADGAPPPPPLRDAAGWMRREADGGPPAISAHYEPYYRAQRILPDSDWPQLLAAWEAPLPVTFRVNPLAPDAAATSALLRSHPQWSVPFPVEDGRVLAPPRELPWLSEAWQLGYGKADLRRNAPLKAFHEWLITLTAAGTVSRQEAVSMVPPLLLGVQPGHHVLDMCAAPGSKTAQLLEALHAGEMGADGAPPAAGMVVANDSDSKRAYMLTHQCQRIGSHALVVCCHDAQLFPNLTLRGGGKGGGGGGRGGGRGGRRGQQQQRRRGWGRGPRCSALPRGVL